LRRRNSVLLTAVIALAVYLAGCTVGRRETSVFVDPQFAALVPPDRLKGVNVGHVKISFYVPPEKRSPLYTRFLNGVKKTGPVDGILQSPGYGWDAMQVLAIAYKQAGGTDPDKVKAALEKRGLKLEVAEITRLPKQTVRVESDVAKRVLATFDLDTLLQQTASLIQHHFNSYDVSIFMAAKGTDDVTLRVRPELASAARLP
jgi:hypothetical protein